MSHHEFSPSKFPQLEKCLHFDSDNSKTDDVNSPAMRGTLQHTLLEKMLNKAKETGSCLLDDADKKWSLETLSNEEREFVMHSFHEILQIVSKHDVELSAIRVEQSVCATTSDMVMVDGTADVMFVDSEGSAVIIDYKSGQDRDYSGQMKVYGLAVAQELGCEKVHTYITYGRGKRQQHEIYNVDDLLNYFDEMVSKIESKDDFEPSPCDYCNWCKNAVSCPARNTNALEVRKVVDSPLKGITKKTDLRKISDEKLGEVFEFSKVVEKWAKDVKKVVEERIDSPQGMNGYSYKFTNKRAMPKTDILFDKMEEMGYSLGEFLEACSVTQASVKKVVGAKPFKEEIVPMLLEGKPSKTITKREVE